MEEDKTFILRPSGAGSDGKEQTRILRPSSLSDSNITKLIPSISRPSQEIPSVSLSDTKLEMLRKIAGIDDGGEKTRLFRRNGEAIDQSNTQVENSIIDVSDNPITAWLVIIKGSGKGIALSVGEYENNVGRGAEARVQVNYGDLTISNSEAFLIYYDPNSRSFKILNGSSSQNPVYVNGNQLAEPIFLNRGDIIEVGKTAFRFIPFCDSAFDWSNLL